MTAPLDLERLEAAARAAGGEQWTSEAVEDSDCAVVWGADGDGVALAYHCLGHKPHALSDVAIAAHIAAANPAVILALLARLRIAESPTP